jgi:hypothetical protein
MGKQAEPSAAFEKVQAGKGLRGCHATVVTYGIFKGSSWKQSYYSMLP